MVEIGAGERIAGEAGLGVTLLADTEHFGAAEVRSEPGGIAPPLHVHERHAEAFFIFAGELTYRFEDGERRVGPETWVFVPPGVAHMFSVTGDTPARFLDVHVPSQGFGDFVRGLQAAETEDELKAARAAFDLRPPPEYATGDPGLVVVHRTGGADGETLRDSPETGRATILVDADELTVSEFVFPAGRRGAQLHVHREHADAFLVLDGEFAFHTRDGTLAAPAGTLVLFPPNVVHGFDNDSAETARCFNFHMPSTGFAEYMRGRNPAFDQHDPPEGGGLDPSAIVAVRLDGGGSTDPHGSGSAGFAGAGAG